MQIKQRYAEAGITVWNIGNPEVHNMPEVTLNLPGRDRKIEEYKNYLRYLGAAGIHYTVPESASVSTAPATPRPSGNLNQTGIAYSIAYMRALRDRANREAQA